MIAYASRTGTKRNLAALRAAGWRLMVSATGVWRTEGFPYALDNGAWTAHNSGTPWDVDKFLGVVDLLGDGADWIVAPDIVAGGAASLERTLLWLPRLPGRRMIAVQDGMIPEQIGPYLSPSVGIFVGGTTEWKEQSLQAWGQLARVTGCLFHVGRVNTARRIRLCGLAGANSFDGSSASRFVKTLPALERARARYSSGFKYWDRH